MPNEIKQGNVVRLKWGLCAPDTGVVTKVFVPAAGKRVVEINGAFWLPYHALEQIQQQ